jgi:hypothetical protein
MSISQQQASEWRNLPAEWRVLFGVLEIYKLENPGLNCHWNDKTFYFKGKGKAVPVLN